MKNAKLNFILRHFFIYQFFNLNWYLREKNERHYNIPFQYRHGTLRMSRWLGPRTLQRAPYWHSNITRRDIAARDCVPYSSIVCAMLDKAAMGSSFALASRDRPGIHSISPRKNTMAVAYLDNDIFALSFMSEPSRECMLLSPPSSERASDMWQYSWRHVWPCLGKRKSGICQNGGGHRAVSGIASSTESATEADQPHRRSDNIGHNRGWTASTLCDFSKSYLISLRKQERQSAAYWTVNFTSI